MTSNLKGMQRYEMKCVVGEGAYGKVFMARNKETGETGKLQTQTHKIYCLQATLRIEFCLMF